MPLAASLTDLANYLAGSAEYLLAGLYIAMALAVSIHTTLWKRDSRAVIGWIGVAWLSPYIGALAYYLFGINRIHRRAVQLSVRRAWRHAEEIKMPTARRLNSSDGKSTSTCFRSSAARAYS